MKLLIVIALMLCVATASAAQSPEIRGDGFGNALRVSPNDSLVLMTQAEALKMIRLLDEMELKIDLLEADLKECRADLPGAESWVMRWVKHPVLWLGVGVATGMVLAGD